MTIQPLLELMDKLQETHEALLELAEVKTQILVDNEIDRLNIIVNKEKKLVRAISETEQQRIQFIGGYLISRGYNPNPKITIGDLVKIIFKVEDKQALMEAQHKLLTTVVQLKKLNVRNQQLIEQSLAFIDYSLDLYLGSPDDDYTYSHPVQSARSTARTGLFDTKA
ncbi:flagellar protein FlgN [Paenibacillus andongensis]|uniref:flagellar protein FlgN n=1 Tax=Paenibacillus andongensis TaxID=2975482 RepID=UPI0021BB0CCB|nr:flagellar protein FlgN [Paenibacillus andongensis]